MAFIAECRMAANCWLRPGDSYTTNNFTGFIEDTFGKLQGKKVGLIRADSGFYGKELFESLENGSRKPVSYIVVRKFYRPYKTEAGHTQDLAEAR